MTPAGKAASSRAATGYVRCMKFMHVVTVAALAMMAVVPAAAAPLSQGDAAYLKSAIQIQAGRFAMATYEAQHGSGPAKTLAATIATQSSNDSRMLGELAKRYGVTPDKGLSIQDRYHYSQLVGMSGSALDKVFARELGISDKINQDTYKQEIRSGRSVALKSNAKQRYAAVQNEINALKRMS